VIVSIGVDVTEIDRIARSLERFGRRFTDRVLTPLERSWLPASPRARAAYVAGRFAGKEAALKALGTGMAEGIGLHAVEIRRQASGRPELVLLGRAAQRAGLLGARRFLVSLTHGRAHAAAVVVLEDDGESGTP
jgi:holo-[acyl-carrier protein] synthase